jgi:hypothetical protein
MGEGSRITVDELIRIGIDGKSLAASRYDAIIWKIRTGYALVIYGAITAFSALTAHDETTAGSRWVVPLIVGAFSLAAFTVDRAFSRSKFRVIASRNELIRESWALALSGFSRDALAQREERLIKLSEMSGEREDPVTKDEVRDFLRAREIVLVFSALYAIPIAVSAAAVALADL